MKLREHKSEILERSSLIETQFMLMEKLLSTVIKFARQGEYSEFLSSAMKLSPDPDDADFFALALEFDCSIWSEDRRLAERQSEVKVYSCYVLITFSN